MGSVTAARPRWEFVLAALLVVAGEACATGAQGNPFVGGAGGGAKSILLEVQNLNFNDATLYAVSSAHRYRLGTVTGKSDANFQIPWESQAAVQVEIDLLAGEDVTTNAVSAAPGDRLQLVIQPDVRLSTLQG